MSRVTSAQTNFTAGEFSPRLLGRFDIDRYKNGAKTLKNVLIHNAGGASKRPGSKYVGEVKDSSLATRLIEFTFSTTQTYIIEMGNLYMRFYSDNGRVTEDDVTITGVSQADPAEVTAAGHGYSNGDWVVITGVVGMTELNGKVFKVANSGVTFTLTNTDDTAIDSTAYTAYTSGGTVNKVLEVATPYTTAQLFDVQIAQTADLMFLVHNSHAPRTLSRTAANAFTLATITFIGGPFKDDNTTAVTITPSADSGNGITLTASSPIFDTTNHVGAFWKVKDGYVKINSLSSTTVVDDCDVQVKQDGTAGDLNTGVAATTDWAEGAWSLAEGYPGVVSFHEQRAVYGRTTEQPQTFWGSYIRVFEDFFGAFNTEDSDSYAFTISTEQVNAIRWMSSGAKALQIGTFGGTFSASSGSTNAPITPSSIVVQRDTTYGASKIPPKRIGNFVYYIQRNLTSLRELGFDFDIDAQRALDMTLLADHALDPEGDTTGAVDMAYQQSPNNVLWVVRSDGEVATLTRQIDQEVIGWSRQVLGGSFQTDQAKTESVAIIPGLTGDDQVWLIVKRTINSTTRRFVEFIMPQTFVDKDDYFGIDSGLSLDSAKTITGATAAKPVVISSTAHGFSDGDQIKIVDVVGMTDLNDKFYLVANKNANDFELTDTDGNDIDGTGYDAWVSGGEAREMVTTISGLDHLEGQTVKVLADGAVRPDKTVSSGSITLSSKAAKVHVGLGYNADIELLPFEDGSPQGTGRTKMRKIYEIALIMYRTLGLQIGQEDNLVDVIFRTTTVPQDQSPALFTGTKIEPYPHDWNVDGEVFIRQSQPLPMFILAIVLKSEVVDK